MNDEYLSKLLAVYKQLISLGGQDVNNVNNDGELIAPIQGKYDITQGFGNYNPALYGKFGGNSRHLGMDLATPSGTLVRAPISGKAQVGYNPEGYGQYVDIVGDDGTVYRFSHLSALERALMSGENVKAGQTIGKTGGEKGSYGAGNSTGAHLDMSVKRNGQWVDPTSVYKNWG